MTKDSKHNTRVSVPREIPLSHEVRDLDGTVIVQKGELFSSQLLRKISRGAPRAKPFLPMKDFSTLWQDINHAFNEFPLKHLFRRKGLKGNLQKAMLETTIHTLIIEVLHYFREKDPYTYWHSIRVFILTAHTALNLLSDPEESRMVASMGPLHDLGKVGVPLDILQKATPLTLEESSRIKHHVFIGSILLSYYLGDFKTPATRVTLEHHERMDGSGYPFGSILSDRNVAIVAACDVYDALISPRPYRNRAYDFRTCLEILTQKALAGALPMDIVRFLIALHRKGKEDYRALNPSLETRGVPPEQNCYGQVLKSS